VVPTGSFIIIKLTQILNEKDYDKEIIPAYFNNIGSLRFKLYKRDLQHEYALEESSSFTHYGDFGG
jgi:hypothetical protein